MSSETALKVQHVGKRYEIYEAPHHRLLQALLRGRKQFFKPFWALRDISFEIKKGECLGILGRNGSGKSTLLKIIAGALMPTSGNVWTSGKAAALLELGGGFSPDFTGRENVYMNGMILGLTRTQMERKFDEIAAFADIGNFIDQPVRVYSGGMHVRLAFAVASAVRPDILIVDEALAVGDAAFQRKCFQRIEAFRAEGTSLVFVSHAVDAVKRLCDRALFLDRGLIKMAGKAKDACDAYEKHLFGGPVGVSALSDTKIQEGRLDSSLSAVLIEKQYGDGGAHISSVAVELGPQDPTNVIPEGVPFQVSYAVSFLQACSGVRFGVMIKTVDGVSVYRTNTTGWDIPRNFDCGQAVSVRFALEGNLVPGNYYLNVGVTHEEGEGGQCLHRRVDCAIFRVSSVPGRVSGGYANLFAIPSVEWIRTEDPSGSKAA